MSSFFVGVLGLVLGVFPCVNVNCEYGYHILEKQLRLTGW